MGGTFKSEIQKNVKKIKLGDYIGRYARKNKMSRLTPLSPIRNFMNYLYNILLTLI
jgi:hypothetical protein